MKTVKVKETKKVVEIISAKNSYLVDKDCVLLIDRAIRELTNNEVFPKIIPNAIEKGYSKLTTTNYEVTIKKESDNTIFTVIEINYFYYLE